jgi:C1A family cysteine protease
MAYKVQRFGWLPDLPDHRDHLYAAPLVNLGILPATVDLRTTCPPVYDQGQLGSCTANAIAGAIQFDRLKESKTDFVPSRLFIYYNERVIEGTVNTDSGAMIRDGIKSVATQGDAPEADWPYDITKFTQTGQVNMPGPNEQEVGGHAVVAVGYDDAQQRFIVRNSWGTGWGMAGYFTMPYTYLTEPNLSDDFWTVRVVL